MLMGLPSGSRIWLAAGVTDLRKGMDGLSALVQTALPPRCFIKSVTSWGSCLN